MPSAPRVLAPSQVAVLSSQSRGKNVGLGLEAQEEQGGERVCGGGDTEKTSFGLAGTQEGDLGVEGGCGERRWGAVSHRREKGLSENPLGF